MAIVAFYLGGAGIDDCDDVIFDAAGFAYLACHSSSEGFTGTDKKDVDAYVVKFDPRTAAIVYSTRIDGSSWDAAFRVVVDTFGNAWVSGTTQSKDLPTHGSARRLGSGVASAFVARLDSQGRIEDITLVGDASGEGLVVTPSGTAYLAGTKAPNAEKTSAYVVEIPKTGEPRILVLGPGTTTGLALDGRGSLFAVGFSGKGSFVPRINLSTWRQTAFRTIGTADVDRVRAVVTDREGRPHILGTVASSPCPTAPRPASKTDVLLAGFDTKLKRLRYCSLFGGTAEDQAGFNGGSLKFDKKGNLWAVGMTRSPDLPATGKFAGADDGFVASFSSKKGRLRSATYVGGEGFEMLEGIAVAPDGAVWATGLTSSQALASPGHHGGRTDAVLIRVK
ncbi:MAG: hypothetical protein HY820_08225 [Acidobacteria bacterium]|nr:hypothetical protein [Acidobacteriota bacterium]